MSLDELYQKKIMDLVREGREIGRLENPDATARADNPLCGDRVTMDFNLDAEQRVTETGQRVRGCALCEAAAALIAAEATGLNAAEIAAIAETVQVYLKGGDEAALPWTRLSAFAPVRALKARHECVLLPFKAVAKALGE